MPQTIEHAEDLWRTVHAISHTIYIMRKDPSPLDISGKTFFAKHVMILRRQDKKPALTERWIKEMVRKIRKINAIATSQRKSQTNQYLPDTVEIDGLHDSHQSIMYRLHPLGHLPKNKTTHPPSPFQGTTSHTSIRSSPKIQDRLCRYDSRRDAATKYWGKPRFESQPKRNLVQTACQSWRERIVPRDSPVLGCVANLSWWRNYRLKVYEHCMKNSKSSLGSRD